jgi:hypothetical protein
MTITANHPRAIEPLERTLTAHHDGLGLNDLITLVCDAHDPNSGGASHEYMATIGDRTAARIAFQHGPRHEPGSTPGITDAVLLVVLIDRLEGFQAGPYACVENDEQLFHLRAALDATQSRARERATRGVLGKNQR